MDIVGLGLTVLGYSAVAASLVYAAFALLRVARLGRTAPAPVRELPPISILKPVCGLEPGLYDNLRSFCDQDYPEFQILFGVRDRNDPAIPTLKRLVREFPHRSAELVIDARTLGTNLKISNVANMIGHAKHDIIAIADSDCRVERDYLGGLAASFADPDVGAATCLYRAKPVRPTLAARLGAMFINEWFLPSVLVALATEPLAYCFGSTMAVRREALDAIGGISALASYLADDHMLGRLTVARGYRVALARPIVELSVDEPGLAALLRHELRWGRTMRTVRPFGYAMSFVTDALPLSLLWALLTGFAHGALILVGFALALRLLMHWVATRILGIEGAGSARLVPARDLLNFAVRAASFMGRGVQWRERDFSVRADGRMMGQSIEQAKGFEVTS
jgi:ceramide glucosyltransferase